jgi:hypothetical protein
MRTPVRHHHPSFLASVPPTVRRRARVPHLIAPTVLAAAVGMPWATWIRTGTLCPGCWVTVPLGRAVKPAHWPCFIFSKFSDLV